MCRRIIKSPPKKNTWIGLVVNGRPIFTNDLERFKKEAPEKYKEFFNL